MESREDFINALFDNNEGTGYGNTNNEVCHSKTKQQFLDDTTSELFSVNPFNRWKVTDNMKNVSLLFEVDEGGLTAKEQIKLFLSSGIPFTTMTYSGGKSMHVIIRFNNSFEGTNWSYQWWYAIARVLKKYGIICDERARLVTQISRVPDVIRENTQKKQTLIYVRDRVDHTTMLEWIKQNGEMVYKPKEPKEIDYTANFNNNEADDQKFRIANKWTENKYGKYIQSNQSGNWNWLFLYGQNCFTKGLELNYAINYANIEFGTTTQGSGGSFQVAEAIKAGWLWMQKKK